MRKLLNLLAFQIGWFSCVLGAANGLPWLGPAVVAVLVGLHLAWTVDRRGEIALLAGVTLLGGLADSLQIALGVLEFPVRNGVLPEWLVPLWIWAMWTNFATTLRSSLAWLCRKPLLAAVLGAVGASTTYLFGAKLGALHMEGTMAKLTVLGVEWAVLLPVMGWMALRRPPGPGLDSPPA